MSDAWTNDLVNRPDPNAPPATAEPIPNARPLPPGVDPSQFLQPMPNPAPNPWGLQLSPWSLGGIAAQAGRAMPRPDDPTSDMKIPSPGGFATPPPRTGPYGQPPFKPAEQQLYIPSSPNRDADQWGRDAQHPMLPQMWQVPGIYRGVGQQLSQWGSGGVAPIAARLFQSSGAYAVNYAKGQQIGMQLQHQKMVNDAMALQNKLQQELATYGELFSLFGTDPKNEPQLKDALRHAADTITHDEHLKAALDTVGVEGAHRYMQWLDSKFRDTKAATTQQLKQQQAEEALDPWMLPQGKPGSPSDASTKPPSVPGSDQQWRAPGALPEIRKPEMPTDDGVTDSGGAVAPADSGQNAPGQPSESQGAQGAATESPTPEQQAAAPATPQGTQESQQADAGADPLQRLQSIRNTYAQASPDEMSQITGVQGQGGTRQPPAAAPGAPQAGAQPQGVYVDPHSGRRLNPDLVDQVADLMLLGQWKPQDDKNTPQLVRGYGELRKNQKQQQLQNIQRQAAQIQDATQRKQFVIGETNKISSSLGGYVEGIVNGQIGPPKGYSLRSPPMNLAYPLARAADPTINENTFATRHRAMIDYSPGGRVGTQYRYVANAFNLINKTVDAVKNQPGLISELAAAKGGRFASILTDPQKAEQYGILRALIRDSIAETEKAVTGGKPTVTERVEQERETDVLMQNPSTIIGQLEGRYVALKGALDEMRQGYQDATGLDPSNVLGKFSPQDQEVMNRTMQLIQGKASAVEHGNLNQGLPPGVTIEKE